MIRLALPAGDLRAPIAALLETCSLRVEGYGEGSRPYRLDVESREDIRTRVFRERDIPIQVALGNYDLGGVSVSYSARQRLGWRGVDLTIIAGPAS